MLLRGDLLTFKVKGLYMNLKLIHRVIDSYNETLDEADMLRLAFFKGLWEEMDRWSSGPLTAAKHYQMSSDEELLEAWNSDQPLLRIAPATINEERFRSIFAALRDYVAQSNLLSDGDATMLLSLEVAKVLPKDNLALAGSDPVLFSEKTYELAQEVVDSGSLANMVVLIAMLSLRVELEGIATMLKDHFPKGDECHHNPLRCPVCGSEPALAKVGGADSPTDGRGRTLYCQQCGTVWDFDRIRCARCGTHNQGHLHYFNVEGDDGHRIATCDECGNYIRTVFVEESLRPFSYEVEEVVTARLDAIARDPRFQCSPQA